jgi:hypothetical protein
MQLNHRAEPRPVLVLQCGVHGECVANKTLVSRCVTNNRDFTKYRDGEGVELLARRGEKLVFVYSELFDLRIQC